MTIVRKEFVEGLTELEQNVNYLMDLELSNVPDKLLTLEDEVASASSNDGRISALEATVAELKKVIDTITTEG